MDATHDLLHILFKTEAVTSDLAICKACKEEQNLVDFTSAVSIIPNMGF